MAAQARIVLFSWVWPPKVAILDSPPAGPSRQATRPPRGRYSDASRQGAYGLVGWRVIGANNRELGRSAQPAGSVEEACHGAHAAQLTFGRQVSGVSQRAGGGWEWYLSLDGDRVAASSRGYQRQREGAYSLEHFCALFPTADMLTYTFRSTNSRVPGNAVLKTVVGRNGPVMT